MRRHLKVFQQELFLLQGKPHSKTLLELSVVNGIRQKCKEIEVVSSNLKEKKMKSDNLYTISQLLNIY